MMSKRLQAIYEMLPEVSSILDVGTDHCLLPIQIKARRQNIEVAASDIAAGPLQIARKTLENKGICDIVLYLSDGLKQIPKPYECVVIAGMGAMNIINILENSKDYLANVSYLLLQCNRDAYELRKWLAGNGYSFIDERIVLDYKYYSLMLVTKGNASYSEIDCVFGPILRENKSEPFLGYWMSEYKKNCSILCGIDTDNIKWHEISSLIKIIEKELSLGVENNE